MKTELEVLREMVRLAENRRTEELEAFDRLNRYNLSLIAFDAGFLSLMITAQFSKSSVAASGALLLFSIFLSLLAVRPRTIRNAALSVEDDVQSIKGGFFISLHDYLLETAELTEMAVNSLSQRIWSVKRYTIFSALFLALGLLTTYTFYVLN